MKPDDKLYSEQVKAGSRTYFLDVGKAANESLYIQISEAKDDAKPTPARRVIVFEEHLREFNNALRRARRFLLKQYGMRLSDEVRPKVGFDEIRQVYPKAYEKWTAEEDERLKNEFRREESVEALAKLFLRQPGAIKSRLAKLGLIS